MDTTRREHGRPPGAVRTSSGGAAASAVAVLEHGLGRNHERTRIAGAISRGLVEGRSRQGRRLRPVATVPLEVPPELLADVLQPFVARCVDAFVEAGLDASRAGAALALDTTRLGRSLARNRAPRSAIETGFGQATGAACDALEPLLAALDADDRRRTCVELTSYARILLAQALRAWQETSTVLALPAEARQRLLGEAALGVRGDASLECLAEVLGVDPSTPYVTVVSVAAPLPAALLDLPGALRGPSRREVLLPADGTTSWSSLVTGLAVTGPAVPLLEAPGATTLARRAAALVAEDGDPRGPLGRLLVPATDLLGDLLVRGNRLLADLVVAKHLAPLESLPAPRRLRLAELVLHSLECKLPLNQVARSIGIPAQTAHSRMQTARSLLGDALDDPALHLELIVALRSVLPRWREAVAD